MEYSTEGESRGLTGEYQNHSVEQKKSDTEERPLPEFGIIKVINGQN